MPNSKIPYVQLNDTINSQRLRFNQLVDSVGDVSSLTTTANGVVGAINELKTRVDLVDSEAGIDIDSAFSSIGQLSSLDTIAKSSLVEAVNEVFARVNTDSDFHTKFSVVSDSGGGLLQYNNTNGQFTFTGVTDAEVRGHLSVAQGPLAGLTYDDTTGEFNAKYATESDGVGVASFDSDTFNVDANGHVTIPNSAITNGQLFYDNTELNGITLSLGGSGTIGTDDIAEGSTNLYFNGKTTTQLPEGTNLYYTTTRAEGDARAAVSAVDAGGDGSFSYNGTTGEFTYTGPSAAEVRAHISATAPITFSSGVIAANNATTSAKGIASFSSTNFSVSSGAVSIKNDGIARAQLKDEVELIIYNSAGTAVKTLYGAGS